MLSKCQDSLLCWRRAFDALLESGVFGSVFDSFPHFLRPYKGSELLSVGQIPVTRLDANALLNQGLGCQARSRFLVPLQQDA